MKVIIPLAGKGVRLRPFTHSRAKPLFKVVGKTVLGHILDELLKQLPDVEEVIFITGHLGEQIKEFVKSHYPKLKVSYFEQKELKGQAHAIALAEPRFKDSDSDCLIWFVDTISDVDITVLKDYDADGCLFVKEVDDPRRFGIVIPNEEGFIEEIEEKPENPRSNTVNIGLYYVKDSKLLFKCIDELIEKDMHTKGEFYLVDALMLMIRQGRKFKAEIVSVWEDCGKHDAVLKTKRYFLDIGYEKEIPVKNSKIIKPVHIEDGAVIEDSEVGPHVAIGKGAIVKDSAVKDSIIGDRAVVEGSKLKDSILGDDTKVKGFKGKLIIGDDSEVWD